MVHGVNENGQAELVKPSVVRAQLLPLIAKGYWHLSRVTQAGMRNDWSKAQGLVSIRALWIKAHDHA